MRATFLPPDLAGVPTLQAQGVVGGLVAKRTGHAGPAVTPGHYSLAVRDSEAAPRLPDKACGAVVGGLR
ncbi:hypothetical protein [Pseudogemmobacter bohemicus]|uniref:hypothetical protein n=1 Tax=Pseudogemmobacter bohemicus TaxID=2250708 RepID=UPI001300AD9A|nr:hypothetical protein [Pseudogemmobacter bohemicus]